MFWERIEKRSAARDTLEKLLAGQEARIKTAFYDFIRRVSSDEIVNAINRHLAAGDVNAALAMIDYAGTSLGTAANAVFLGSAAKEAASFLTQIQRMAPSVPLAFNQVDPIFAQIANLTGVQFMRETTQTQKNAVLYALEQGYGRGTRKMAQLIRSSIGLTTGQMKTVSNYRRLLETGSAQALERKLRDRRYDPSIDKAIAGKPLTPQQIDNMVEAYRKGMIRQRAKVIAQTDGGHIIEVARETGFRQLVRQAGISEAKTTHTWNTQGDDLVRDLHQPMAGQTVPMREPFRCTDGTLMLRPKDPSAPPRQKCACRCYQTFNFAR